MAIVQVSRITNRKGLTENLPQLSGAELGWAIDSRRLFIGNGTLEEGAPVIGNTEILTEFSDITTLSNYTYEDAAVGYVVQTGALPSTPVVRTVQAKLDDFASVRDFGAVGDGVADDTEAINRALYQLYCRETNSQVRRALYFPAGTYKITETIKIPSYARLIGEGSDSSIIQLDTSGDISSLSAYVGRTADSLQQTGANIGSNGAITPRNIEISYMSFQSLVDTDIFLIEDAVQVSINNVNFTGPLTQTSLFNDGAADNISALRFASTTSLVCEQINIDRCRFQNLTYGVNTDQQIRGVTVSNSEFYTLYQGIVLGAGTPVNGGPTGFRAVQNIFDMVYGEGIVYENVSINASAYNVFYNVGNEFTSSPQSPVISFGNDNNVSISDLFQRPDSDANSYPRIEIAGGTSLSTTSNTLGRYSRLNGRTFAFDEVPAPTTETVFDITTGVCKAFAMQYTIINGTAIRHGTLTVVAQNNDDSALSLSYTDDYTENIPTQVVLSAAQSSSTISVEYSSETSTATMLYSISYLA